MLQCVHGNLDDPKTLTHHKLIHVATERVLSDTKTVADESLKDKGSKKKKRENQKNTKRHQNDSIFFFFFFNGFRCSAVHKEKAAANPSQDG